MWCAEFLHKGAVPGVAQTRAWRCFDPQLDTRPTTSTKLDLIETGDETLTGGRVKRLKPYMGDETFMLTWGDGVSDIDINKLIAFHKSHGKLATITAVRLQARYGHMRFDGDQVVAFEEKPQTAEGWINGAFFVLEAKVW